MEIGKRAGRLFLLAAGLSLQGAAFAQNAYIPLVSKGFQATFWQAVKAGAEKAAKDFNVSVTYEGPESDTQVDKQIDMLEAALAKKPAAVGIAALDSKAVIPTLKKYQAKKIPVIGFDSGVDSDIPVTTCQTDNLAAAAFAAQKLAALIGDEGEVAVVMQDQTSQTGIARRDGFAAEMRKHPKIKIVDVQYGNNDPLKSTEVTKGIIQGHPKLKGIFAGTEGSIVGVLNAVKELRKEGKLTLVGFDAGTQQMAAIRSGVEAGAITQDPIGIGYKTIETAARLLRGEKVPKTVDTGFHYYDKTNIDSPEIAPLLYK